MISPDDSTIARSLDPGLPGRASIVHNENDRQTLEWLRRHIGDTAIAAAIQRCEGAGKPYLSAVCRQLGVRVPGFHVSRRVSPSPVAEQSLATIRRILAARIALTVTRPIASRQK